MGLNVFHAAASAIKTNLRDQYKDVISCEDMGDSILMMKKSTETGRITNKSLILVQPGQMAILVDSGQILDATAVEGVYNFEDNGTPSFFAGEFGASFKDMWSRFTFGGGAPKNQCVYFINTKEILDNGFGTATPIMYKDWDHAVMNPRIGGLTPMSVDIKCFGKYTFKIDDPSTFLREIGGTAKIFEKSEITDQMRTEVIASFQAILNSLGSAEHKIGALELPSQTFLIKSIMDEKIYDQAIRNRGMKIVSFAVESVTLSEESKANIRKWELGSDSYTQQAVLTESYGEAMKNAASNANGAANGFMGLGFMNMTSGGMFGQVPGNTAAMQQGQQIAPSMQPGMQQNMQQPQMAASVAASAASAQPQAPAQAGTSICPNCGAEVVGKFCAECGTPAQ